MSLSANFPTVRPSLVLDFASSRSLDPRITFARASTATYYDGKTTVKAEENLLLRSQDYSATWTVTNLTAVIGKTAPDATTTATEFTASAANAVLTQGYTAVAGSYTFSVFLRRVTGTGDIQIAADNGTWTTKVITGTWAKYDVTQTITAGSKTAGIRVVTSGDVIEVWGAQLEQRSAVTAYTPTTTQAITNYVPQLLTAATGVARFEHNPVTRESLGLEIEESRTNLLTYSEQFDNAAWIKTNLTLTANAAVAPDGTQTADAFAATSANAAHFFQSPNTLSFTSGTAYTQSIYAKAVGSAGYRLRLRFNSAAFTSSVTADFDLAAGTIANVSGVTATITPVGNGWYRCTATATATATTTNDIYCLILNASGTQSFAGDGYSGALLWGYQLEAGAFATSYIPTVASQVTRSADAASMTGTNFSSWYRADEGTLYLEQIAGGSSTSDESATVISDGSINNSIYISWVGSTLNRYSGFMYVGNVSQLSGMSEVSNTTLRNTNKKAALAYKTNDVNAAFSGALRSNDTSANLPVVDRLNIGSNWSGTNRFTNGTIKKIAYYPLRLSDAQLQALTTV